MPHLERHLVALEERAAIGASVTLSDSSIGFTVQDQATGTPEEAVPAGSGAQQGGAEIVTG